MGGDPETQWTVEEIAELGAVDVMADGTVIGSLANQVKTSTDSGDNWSNAGTLPASIGIACLFVDADGNIFASGLTSTADDAGLYRSIDGGANFTKVLAMAVDTGVWGIDQDASGNLFAGEYSRTNAGAMKIWKSTDGGENWVQKFTFTGGSGYDEHHIHQVRVDPRTGYIYATSGDGAAGTNLLLRSTDAGENWTTIYTGTQFAAIAFLGLYVYLGTDDVENASIYRFIDTGGETVTPEKIYESPAGYGPYFYTGSENDTDMLFGQAELRVGVSHHLIATAGTFWIPIKSLGAAVAGFTNISRHNYNGTFYIPCPTTSYRVTKQ